MVSYQCKITSSVLKGVGAGYIMGACIRGWVCVCAGYLRSALHAQGAHLVHPHVDHIHTLACDLKEATLEVLLIVHVHLEVWRKNEVKLRPTSDDESVFFSTATHTVSIWCCTL